MRYAIITAILALGLAGCNLNGVNFDVSGLPSLEVNGDCTKNSPQDGGGNCRLVWKDANKVNPSLPTGTWRYGDSVENSSLGVSHSAGVSDWGSGELKDRNKGFVTIEADFSKNRIIRFDGYTAVNIHVDRPYKKYFTLNPNESKNLGRTNYSPIELSHSEFLEITGVVIDPETGEITGRVFRPGSTNVYDVSGSISTEEVKGKLKGLLYNLDERKYVDWDGIGEFQADKVSKVHFPTGTGYYKGRVAIDREFGTEGELSMHVDFDQRKITHLHGWTREYTMNKGSSQEITIDMSDGTFSGEVQILRGPNSIFVENADLYDGHFTNGWDMAWGYFAGESIEGSFRSKKCTSIVCHQFERPDITK